MKACAIARSGINKEFPVKPNFWILRVIEVKRNIGSKMEKVVLLRFCTIVDVRYSVSTHTVPMHPAVMSSPIALPAAENAGLLLKIGLRMVLISLTILIIHSNWHCFVMPDTLYRR